MIDEATAGLDDDTAALVTASVARLTPRCAMLAIAHRLETVRGADLIMVLDGGHVIERGRHDELLARGGAYARLLWADGGLAA